MTPPEEETGRALGRLEGSLAALVVGVSDLKGDLIDRIDTEARQREQTAVAAVAAVERLETFTNSVLTALRHDWQVDLASLQQMVAAHDDRIAALEQTRAHERWFRELLQPWRALIWTSLGVAVAESIHLIIT